MWRTDLSRAIHDPCVISMCDLQVWRSLDHHMHYTHTPLHPEQLIQLFPFSQSPFPG